MDSLSLCFGAANDVGLVAAVAAANAAGLNDPISRRRLFLRRRGCRHRPLRSGGGRSGRAPPLRNMILQLPKVRRVWRAGGQAALIV